MAESTDETADSQGDSPAGCPSAEAVERLVTEGVEDENVLRHLDGCARCQSIAEQIREDDELIRPFAAAALHDSDSPYADSALPRIEGYEILSEIHRGGQGIVYKAIQKATRRKVAVKMLLPGVLSSAKHRIRFEREIVVVAKLNHPNIITLYESGVTGEGRHYYAMEYLRGLPLDEFARRAPSRGLQSGRIHPADSAA